MNQKERDRQRDNLCETEKKRQRKWRIMIKGEITQNKQTIYIYIYIFIYI